MAALTAVFGMSIVTYVTKAGGFWLLEKLELPDPVRNALDALPGGVIVAILSVRLSNGGPPEWAAGLVVLAVARRTDSVLLAMTSGVGVLLVLRGGIGELV